MAKLLKKFLALCAVAALLFACAACNRNQPGDTTEPDTSETTTTEPDTQDVLLPQTDDETTEPDITAEAPTADGETTTAEATTGVPKSKADIIAYVNEVMAKVREDKPGYSFTEITHIDDKNIKSSNGAIRTLAKGVVAISKGFWSKWTDPKAKEKGGDHGGVNPKAELTASMVKSASCTDNGSTYQIRINIVDERVTKLPDNEKDTMHGRIMMAQTKGGIEDGASKVGVKFSKAEILYTGSYIELTVNKTTGLPKKITAYTGYNLDMIVEMFGGVDAVIPLANEKLFTF